MLTIDVRAGISAILLLLLLEVMNREMRVRVMGAT